MDFNTDVTLIDENYSDLQLSQATSALTSQYTFIDIITKKRNRMGPAAGPTLILKSWLGLREVEDWELKLDAEEELQVEEVDILEYSSGNIQLALDFLFSLFNINFLFSTQIYQIFRLRPLSSTFKHLIFYID